MSSDDYNNGELQQIKVEMAECNVELAELFLDELDMYDLHMTQPNANLESRVVRASNKLHRQRNHFSAITHGEKLRRFFGYK